MTVFDGLLVVDRILEGRSILGQGGQVHRGVRAGLRVDYKPDRDHFWVLRHYGEKKAEEKRETLKKKCFLIPVNEEIAVEAARLKSGLKTSLADSLILATARGRGAKVVTGDPDFKQIPDAIFIGE